MADGWLMVLGAQGRAEDFDGLLHGRARDRARSQAESQRFAVGRDRDR